MQIDIKNPKQILSQFLIKNHHILDTVGSTEDWKKDGKLTAKVLINNIEVDAESFESTLQGLFERVKKHYADKYDADNLDNLVEERAKELLKQHADNALETLYNLTRTLEESEELLVPHWERK